MAENPFSLESLLSNVIANLASSGVTWLISKAYSWTEPESKTLTTINSVISKSLKDEAEFKWEGTVSEDKVVEFLQSPEAAALSRQIYAVLYNNSKSINEIKRAFVRLMAIHTKTNIKSIKSHANALFDDIVFRCQNLFDKLIQEGDLFAHEAQSRIRHRLLIDELKGIKRNVAFLTNSRKLDLPSILEFEKRYREQVKQRHSTLMPPVYSSSRRKVPIDKIYVTPHFNEGQKGALIEIDKLQTGLHRTVILGNPGGGKSTFTLKLCYELTSNNWTVNGKNLTPILVILKDYGTQKQKTQCSIMEFVEATANSHYQVESPKHAFEYLLRNGRAIVIFDGLDELLDTRYRTEITLDVESFCNLYPSVPVLVTSRFVGYEQAPLSKEMFNVIQLSPFDDGQIKEYVKKWFHSDEDHSLLERKAKADAFLEESETVPNDITSSPLLLSLLCNMYRSTGYVPKNRPAIYERCSTMLFETWDKSRGINYELPFEQHIRPAMMYLAHWIYTTPDLQSGVTEHQLIRKASEYLIPKRFEDEDEAAAAAKEFIEFCRGRAWVFTDIGTTAQGEELYQFTHRTFLEYFTASHLIRTAKTEDKLLEILLPRIAKQEWDIVAQLAFQQISQNNEDASDIMLNSVVNMSEKTQTPNEAWNYLEFVTKCLSFIVPSPKTTYRITSACISRCIKDAYELGLMERWESLLDNLFLSSVENHKFIEKALIECLTNEITSSKIPNDIVAYQIAESYIKFTDRGKNDGINWREVCSSILDNLPDYIVQQLCLRYIELSHGSFFDNRINIEQVIKWHGLGSLVFSTRFIPRPRCYLTPIADSLMAMLISSSESPETFGRFISRLRDISRIVERKMLPITVPTENIRRPSDRMVFFGIEDLFIWLQETETRLKGYIDRIECGTEIIFALWFSIVVSIGENIDLLTECVSHFQNSDIDCLQKIAKLIDAHLVKSDKPQANTLLSEFEFTDEQHEILLEWIQDNLQLVEKTEDEPNTEA